MADSISGLGSVSDVLWLAPSAVKDLTSSYVSAAKFYEFVGTTRETVRILEGIGQVIEETFVFKSKDEQYEFLSFFEKKRGSAYRFWAPVWINAFSLYQKVYAGDSTIYIKKCGFAQSYQGYERIWMLLNDGSRIVRKVIDAQEDIEYEVLTLDTPVDRDIDVGGIKCFGRFILCRFGSNEVEMEYTTPDYATCTVKLYELVQEYDESNIGEINPFAELYDFIFPETTYYFTSFYKNVEFNRRIYIAVPMRRSNIEQSLNIFTDNKVEIVSRPTEALRRYVYNATLLRVEVIITRLDLITGEAKVIFRGMGNAVALKDEFISLAVTPISAVFDFRIPRILYQTFCNNVLFGKGCGLVKDSFGVITPVVDNRDGTLKAQAFAEKPNGWFTGGFVYCDNEYRLITNHIGDTVWLQVSFNIDITGKKVIAYPGCDGSPYTCRDRFNNLHRFVGFPYIPSKNPVIWGIR